MNFTRWSRWARGWANWLAAATFAVVVAGEAAGAESAEGERLTLHATRQAATDLEVSGLLVGVPAGESRWVSWADLRALPSQEIETEGEFLPGKQRVRLVFLREVLDRLPVAPGFDAVTATCTDGYASVFPRAFIDRWQPYVVIDINGAGPEHWPPKGMSFNPGPYVITVSDLVTPGVSQLPDISHKQPWGVSAIKLVREAEEFAPLASGAWASLSASALRGRELWVHSCYSCHKGPGEEFGGTKSGRPFAVLQAYAKHNPAYFKNYVRDPKKLNASTQMSAHPHYSDAQIADLKAFVLAETEKK
jgi:hypothetical protein